MSELIKTTYPYCYVFLAQTSAPHMRKAVLENYIKTFMSKYEPSLEYVGIKGTYALCRRK